MTCGECYYFRGIESKPGKGGCWVNPPAVYPMVTQDATGQRFDVASVRPAEVGRDDPACKEFRRVLTS
jgi:hypothetical protein